MKIFENVIILLFTIFLTAIYFGCFFGLMPAVFGMVLITLVALTGLNSGKEFFAGMALTEEDLTVGSIYQIESASPHSDYFALAEILEEKNGELEAKVVNRYFYLPTIRDEWVKKPKIGDIIKISRAKNGKILFYYYDRNTGSVICPSNGKMREE